MGKPLIDDLAHVTPVVIDFEYTTPTGAPPEAIEVAVQVLHVVGGTLACRTRWEALMRPPKHAELTPFDIDQTGITPDMVADRPYAGEVLATLDRRFTAGPYVLIAHHAPAEANLIYAYREHCPNLARIGLIDTVRLARKHYPDLPRHGLDDLIRHLKMPVPANRHRAMADVEVTTELFSRMVTESDWVNLRQLRCLAGCEAKAAKPQQIALFG